MPEETRRVPLFGGHNDAIEKLAWRNWLRTFRATWRDPVIRAPATG